MKFYCFYRESLNYCKGRFFSSWGVFYFPFLSAFSIFPVHGGGMEIKTSTDLNSAEICLRVKEGPSITSKEIEDDKKRTVLGIGEVVSLELVDNSDETKVIWEYEDPSQEQFAKLEKPRKGRKTIKLTVQKNLEADTSIGIKVTNEFGQNKSVTFELKIPQEFKGQHTPGNNLSGSANEGTVPEIRDKDGNLVPLQPGQPGVVGAAALLSVKVLPLDVSFDNVKIIEKANDPPESRPVHTPNPNPLDLGDTNEFQDTIVAFAKGAGLPKGWTWSCSWKVVDDGGNAGLLITGKDVPQTVSFERTDHGGSYGIKTTINKFDCTVSRDSLSGKYEFESKK